MDKDKAIFLTTVDEHTGLNDQKIKQNQKQKKNR